MITVPPQPVFLAVAKEVITVVVQGVVVDYCPPLFSVVWSDGSEDKYNKKELDHFRRLGAKHEQLAEKREKARQDRIAGIKRNKPGGGGNGGGVGGGGGDGNPAASFAVKAETPRDENASALEAALVGPASSKGMLEWRLLEVAAARLEKLKEGQKNGGGGGGGGSGGGDDDGGAGSGGGARGEGHVFVKHCAALAVGNEPSDWVWRQAGSAVTSVSVHGSGLKPYPPKGLRALPCLETLDLSDNALVVCDPPPLEPPPMSELEMARLKAKEETQKNDKDDRGSKKKEKENGEKEAAAVAPPQPDGGICTLLKTLLLRSNKLGQVPDTETLAMIASSDAANTAAGGGGSGAGAGSKKGGGGGNGVSKRASSGRGANPIPGRLPPSSFSWCKTSLEVK